MHDGIINIYKEKGFTSFDVVAILRRKFGTRKVGHTGTLDPEAEGVLPVCLGKATKAVEYLVEKDKTYRATMVLGTVTDTQDHTGRILRESPVAVEPAQVEQVLGEFVGNILQVPPMYSALKVQGQKLCDLARKGREVERKPRETTIHSISDIHWDSPREVSFTVDCSKGTYIRTLCHDAGERLGCGAHMGALVRTRSGDWKIQDSIPLSAILDKEAWEEQNPEGVSHAAYLDSLLTPVDRVFPMESLHVEDIHAKQLMNGNALAWEICGLSTAPEEGVRFKIYKKSTGLEKEAFIGIYKVVLRDGHRILKPEKLFFLG
ncbi:tRNA pseudouridine(55) synthase TruB [Anaerotalea alkaliphila]|uniref:tRNA pseudouridine synthase B n=1 Tax=Anaerotalea alkaliphila TaxID=2662126 RepID=A0A7X5HTD6_9FIRM|nr:tRNA pseudouridine(55) synthase TruB [Anaerotalea alkaliphila]NDL66323.1 tRNA pseudouridine(55) synthase TruB [Anaerotalea alkaliphila]